MAEIKRLFRIVQKKDVCLRRAYQYEHRLKRKDHVQNFAVLYIGKSKFTIEFTTLCEIRIIDSHYPPPFGNDFLKNKGGVVGGFCFQKIGACCGPMYQNSP